METERERQLEFLCRTKCGKMRLENHLTGYNCLKKLRNPHRANLRRLGYSFGRALRACLKNKPETLCIPWSAMSTENTRRKSCLTFGLTTLTRGTTQE